MTDADLLRLYERRARLVTDYWNALKSAAPTKDSLEELTIVHCTITRELANRGIKSNILPIEEDNRESEFFKFWHQLQELHK